LREYLSIGLIDPEDLIVSEAMPEVSEKIENQDTESSTEDTDQNLSENNYKQYQELTQEQQQEFQGRLRMNAKDILEYLLENYMVHPKRQQLAALVVASMSRQKSGIVLPLSKTFQTLFNTTEDILEEIQQLADFLLKQLSSKNLEK